MNFVAAGQKFTQGGYVTARETDQQLVVRAQRGDSRAFDLLVLKYQGRIATLVARFVNDAAEVEDVTQEAFIKAMIDTIIVEVPSDSHPFGVRGVGETGIAPPLPAIANAVADATGQRLRHLPISPPKILKAIKENS